MPPSRTSMLPCTRGRAPGCVQHPYAARQRPGGHPTGVLGHRAARPEPGLREPVEDRVDEGLHPLEHLAATVVYTVIVAATTRRARPASPASGRTWDGDRLSRA